MLSASLFSKPLLLLLHPAALAVISRRERVAGMGARLDFELVLILLNGFHEIWHDRDLMIISFSILVFSIWRMISTQNSQGSPSRYHVGHHFDNCFAIIDS
ncbi:hypothetical protein BDP27DRAFT_735907 [Rhodocollybia butyracea]|uniref:Secreted protein n=1 Tax=Rhodocollybia butyracea TaxID=206335 RepID=A0A9P5PVC0_9AGAR|nr:hypothetical protein BDP27DRAFT_735907 [Rhodocollybia butyracea]